jgi:rod shape determining protein RodA
VTPTTDRALHVPLAVVTALLGVYGVTAVLSAGRGPASDLGLGLRQGLFLAAGLVVMVVVARFDYRMVRRRYPLLLMVTVAVLVLVLTPLGTEVRGTQGWFRVGPVAIQPSEFAKPTLVVGLAAILDRAARWAGASATAPLALAQVGAATWGSNARTTGFGPAEATAVEPSTLLDRTPSPYAVRSATATGFGLALALFGVLSVLVLAQGESGTVLVYGATTLGVMAVAGIPARYLALTACTGVAVVALAFTTGLLAPYQVARFEAFLDADLDPQGIGYNQQQAITAIGSGGLTGAGLFEGPQTQLGYLPDQHTDFIFAAIGEELGFAGAAAVLVLEAAVLTLVFLIGVEARDRFGRLVCGGVFCLLAFQVFQNVAMNLRLMPITGISLPLVSYGGSSLVATMILLGLVQSVAVNRVDRSGLTARPAAHARIV